MKTLMVVGLSLALAAPAFAQTAPARVAPPMQVPQWIVDPAQSRISFSTRWAGAAVNGAFGGLAADIRFDPARPAASRAIVTVPTGTARTGQKDPDENLPQSDWFNAKAFPNARFETTAIRALGGNRYEADGRLTVKNTTVPVKLPFTLTIAGNVATMRGAATVDRLALGMGRESDPAAEWVDRAVQIQVNVRATRR
jgi:polyisoprenoid-binding protein YceI